MKPAILVAVPTYRRPHGLRALLAALPAAIEGPEYTTSVVVLDNEPADATRAIVDAFADETGLALEYVPVSAPGIAAVRNVALESGADQDYLAFLDDDEIPPPGWLRSLVRGLDRHRADIVAAPVVAVAPAQVPAWLKDPRVWTFDQPPLVEGTTMDWCASNNTLLARRVLKLVPSGFDERYSASGGSDTQFFYRATLAGARIVWLEAPVVSETMPSERATFRWLVRRAYRGGTVRGRVERELNGIAPRTLVRALKGAASVFAGGFLAAAGCATGSRVRAARGVLRAAGGVGTLAGLAGAVYEEYKR